MTRTRTSLLDGKRTTRRRYNFLIAHLFERRNHLAALGPQAVELVLDQAMRDADHIQAHPLRNTATLALSHATLLRFLAQTGHVPRIVTVPATP